MVPKALRRAALIHRGWRYRTSVDREEIRWMRSVLRHGDVAVDVGAYKGGYTYWMREAVGDAGTVFAFEPQPELASYLRQCVRDFEWRNVRIEEIGLSAESGERMLHAPGVGPSPAASLVGASLPEGSRSYEVRVDTLDRFLAEHGPETPVRLMKCDVEGHELDVFQGARETLREHRPLLLFECEARHHPSRSVEDVFGYLERLGYRGFFFWGGSELDVREFDVELHQVEGRRPYGNNFIFVPDGADGSPSSAQP